MMTVELRMASLSNSVLLSISFLLLLLQSLEALLVASNGDTLLYLNGSTDLSNVEGVLQVYISRWHDIVLPEGEWLNVCYEDFNKGGAAAACRQLGFTDSVSYAPYDNYNYQLNPNISRYILTQGLCPSVSNYTKYGDINVLRCSYYATVTNSTNGCTPVGIQCVPKLLASDGPYNGQLMLTNRSERFNQSVSSGYLHMHINGSWYPVCANISYFGAASACRQMGYTRVSATYFDKVYSDNGVYIGTPSCVYTSDQCLTHCYNDTQNYKMMRHCQLVHIVCTFRIKDAPVSSSGSQFLCQIQNSQSSASGNTCSASSSKVGLSVSLGIFVAVSLITGIVVVALSVWICSHYKRRQYKNIKDPLL